MKNGILLVVAAAVFGGLLAYATADRAGDDRAPLAAESRQPVRPGDPDTARQARERRPLIVTRERRPHADPRGLDYDPVRAALLGADISELYDREPRNETWAPAMEDQVGRLMADDLELLFPESELAVDCRASSCRVDVTVDAAERGRALAILQLLAIGDVVEASVVDRPDGRVVVRLYEGLSRDNRDLDEHARWHRDRRDSMLDGLLEDGLIDEGELAALRAGRTP